MPTRKPAKPMKNRRSRDAGFVMVPLSEYERLVAKQMAADLAARGIPPDADFVDIEDADAMFAARRLTVLRRAKGLTQAQLGRLVGLPQSQISRLERNPDRTTVRTLRKIARAMGVNIAALL